MIFVLIDIRIPSGSVGFNIAFRLAYKLQRTVFVNIGPGIVCGSYDRIIGNYFSLFCAVGSVKILNFLIWVAVKDNFYGQI